MTKRINKTTEEISKEMAHKEIVKKQKALAKLIFNAVSNQKTIYDAQTVVTAISGYIKYELQVKEAGIKMSDLIFDLKNQKESEIKKSMITLLDLLKDQNANETAALLERFGQTLAQFSASTFMKKPMSDITVKDLIA